MEMDIQYQAFKFGEITKFEYEKFNLLALIGCQMEAHSSEDTSLLSPNYTTAMIMMNMNEEIGSDIVFNKESAARILKVMVMANVMEATVAVQGQQSYFWVSIRWHLESQKYFDSCEKYYQYKHTINTNNNNQWFKKYPITLFQLMF